MAFLQEISKDIPVVATWNGKIENGEVYHIRKDKDSLVYPVSDAFEYIVC